MFYFIDDYSWIMEKIKLKSLRMCIGSFVPLATFQSLFDGLHGYMMSAKQ